MNSTPLNIRYNHPREKGFKSNKGELSLFRVEKQEKAGMDSSDYIPYLPWSSMRNKPEK